MSTLPPILQSMYDSSVFISRDEMSALYDMLPPYEGLNPGTIYWAFVVRQPDAVNPSGKTITVPFRTLNNPLVPDVSFGWTPLRRIVIV